MRPPRVLYVPNEVDPGGQRGMRRAARLLTEHGLIDSRVYSVLAEVRRGGGESARRRLLEICAEFRPDVLVMQHIHGAGLTEDHLRAIRRGADPRIVYHEGDVYSRWRHPLPSESVIAARHADVVLTVGSGAAADNFRRLGVSDVRWVPSTYDPGTFGRLPLHAAPGPTGAVALIGNRSAARVPWRVLPGSRDRERLVRTLERRFGTGFIVFGRGWTGPRAAGPIPFRGQEQALRDFWVSANWDHYPGEPAFFSNRLPICLASGSIHVTSRHDGYDTALPGSGPFLCLARTVEECAALCREIIQDVPESERLALREQARAYASRHLRQDVQFAGFIEAAGFPLERTAVLAALDSDLHMDDLSVDA